MLRKALVGSAILLTMGSFVFGRDVFSYMRTWSSSVKNAVKNEVPIEFEVERARELVEKLVPDVRDCMHVIAEQQVDIEQRLKEIARREQGIGDQKQRILTLRSDLDSGRSTFQYASRTYTSDQVRRDLALRFNRYKAAEETLSRDQQILAAHRKSLRANEDKLDTLLVAKQDLQVKIEQLEARVKTVQAAEAASSLEFDDSRLARAKSLIRDLNKQLDVKEKMLDAEGKFTGLIPVDSPAEPVIDNITEEIDLYFQSEPVPDEDVDAVAAIRPAA